MDGSARRGRRYELRLLAAALPHAAQRGRGHKSGIDGGAIAPVILSAAKNLCMTDVRILRCAQNDRGDTDSSARRINTGDIWASFLAWGQRCAGALPIF